MNCCHNPQCLGIEQIFDTSNARKNLKRYRKKGASKTTGALIERVTEAGVERASLLDIGGGIGVIAHECFARGLRAAMIVEVSPAYQQVFEEEAARRGHADRTTFLVGNFVDLAPEIDPADIVTLDRVICCYNDMPGLVSKSASKAGRLYGLVFPRDSAWIKLLARVGNLFLRIRGNPFRLYIHPTDRVIEITRASGLRLFYHHKGLFWQVLMFEKEPSRSL